MHTNGSNYQASAILPPANHLLWRDEAPDNIRVVRVNNVVELNACWPWVKERLEIIKKKDKSAGNWIPEHIRHLLILQFSNNSRVELYLAVENETNVLHGFIVTNVLIDPYLSVPMTLHIWEGWLNQGLIEKCLPWLETLARERGLTGVEFESGRFGWMGSIRKLMTSGFVVKKYVYRKEIK